MSIPIPPDFSPRENHYLQRLEARVKQLEARLGQTEDSDDSGSIDSDLSGTFNPQYEAPVIVAEDGAGTEDAWTTVSAGAPAGARFAIIQFYLFADTDNADASIDWRTESGGAEIRACEVDSDEDDAEGQTHINPYFVPLTDGGEFDYLVTTTTGTVQWEIRYIGYHE